MDKLRRFYGQKVLPIVFDDSLSYYEMICKLINAINDVIENNNLLEQYVGAYMPTFNDDWDVTKEYNPLSVVLYNDKLYIAKQAVPVGMSIEAGDYWEEINLPYFDTISNLSTLDLLIPDQFQGTDTEKLKQAFDACADGGYICINRKYNLTDDLIISHLSSRQRNFIHVLGIGRTAEINFNGYTIQGDRAAGEAYGSNSVGGIFWTDINFSGNVDQKGFITDRLIRMFFTNCHFYGLNYAFYGNDTFAFGTNDARIAYAQSYYFDQCYFGAMKAAAFDVYRVFDVHFSNTVFEYDYSRIHVRNGIEGLFINSCLLENIVNASAIEIATSGRCYNMHVINCYFEDNQYSINLRGMDYVSCASVENCMCAINKTGQKFIYMPRNLRDTYGRSGELSPVLKITGNSIISGNSYDGTNAVYFDMYHEDGSPWQYELAGLYFDNNNFELTNGNANYTQLYTLNYRPQRKVYTKQNPMTVITQFNTAGSGTLTFPAIVPQNGQTGDYTITSLKNTLTGADICVDGNGNSVEPSTWFKAVYSSGMIHLEVIKENGTPIIDRDLLRTQAGGVQASAVLAWTYNRTTMPTS